MSRVQELAALALERRNKFSTTLNDIKSRPILPALLSAGVALAFAFSGKRMIHSLAVKLTRRKNVP